MGSRVGLPLSPRPRVEAGVSVSPGDQAARGRRCDPCLATGSWSAGVSAEEGAREEPCVSRLVRAGAPLTPAYPAWSITAAWGLQ